MNPEIPASTSLQASLARQNENLRRIQKARLARTLIVPTDDGQVRKDLRARGLPVCLFGEDAYDRRQRLRSALADEAMLAPDTQPPSMQPPPQSEPQEAPQKEAVQEYYTEGTSALQALRLSLAEHSLLRARTRLRKEQAGDALWQQRERDMIERIRRSETLASTPDVRPICAIATDGQVVVTGNFGGGVAVWDVAKCALRQRLDTHDARVSTVRLGGGCLLTASGDSTAGVHVLENGKYVLKRRLGGHSGRVTDAITHPFRDGMVATAGLDGCVRLWDSGKEVVVQDTGHDGVQRIAMHDDGALLATAGREGGARVWDLRTGRCIITLTGAHTSVTAAAFHSSTLITGGGDNVVRIWDLRKRRCIKTLAAHSGLVSGVTSDGDIMYSSGFDGIIRAWGIRRNWGCVGVWTGLGRVMALDTYSEGVVAGCWDKTWRIWSD